MNFPIFCIFKTKWQEVAILNKNKYQNDVNVFIYDDIKYEIINKWIKSKDIHSLKNIFKNINFKINEKQEEIENLIHEYIEKEKANVKDLKKRYNCYGLRYLNNDIIINYKSDIDDSIGIIAIPYPLNIMFENIIRKDIYKDMTHNNVINI
jgi:hypothetical protein